MIKTFFVKKAAMTDPIKFEAAIDSQHGLPFAMNLGPYRCCKKHTTRFYYISTFRKYWSKFVNEKVHRVLQDQNSGKFREHFFAEVLGLQVQILKPGDGPERERWVYGPDCILDCNGKLLSGGKLDIFWYR